MSGYPQRMAEEAEDAYYAKESPELERPIRQCLYDAIECVREHVKFAPNSLLDITVKSWERALNRKS